jgi:hypothetical protein
MPATAVREELSARELTAHLRLMATRVNHLEEELRDLRLRVDGILAAGGAPQHQ